MVARSNQRPARENGGIDVLQSQIRQTVTPVGCGVAWRNFAIVPHLGLKLLVPLFLLIVSHGIAHADVILHEQASWPELNPAESRAQSFPLTVTGPGWLTIRLKMNPHRYSEYPNHIDGVLQTPDLAYVAEHKGTTVNGAPFQGDLPEGQPLDMSQKWYFREPRTASFNITFTNAVYSNAMGCRQKAFDAELTVDYAPDSAVVAPSPTPGGAANIQSGQFYYLTHQYSGKLVSSDATEPGGSVWLWGPIPNGHNHFYRFKFDAVGSGVYYLRHEHSGLYLCSGETENGGGVWLWGPIPTGHEPRYRFRLDAAAGGSYYLVHEYSGKYLCSGDTSNAGGLWLWGPVPAGHEPRYQFKISP